MRVFVTGGNGRLGRWTLPEFKKAGFEILAPGSSELDITDYKKLRESILNFKPNFILHLAAITGIQECEQNKEKAWRVNVLGTKNIVEICKEADSYLLFMSTPCIFSGDDDVEYSESDLPNPTSFYGLTKLMAESVVLNSNITKSVIRSNFVPYEKWPYQKAFTDRYSNYLFSHDLAHAFVDIIQAKKLPEIIHIAGNKKMSMYELAKMCPDSSNVQPFTLDEYYANKSAVKLTKNMCLSSKTWKKYELTKL